MRSSARSHVATTIRSALQTINPSLSKKLPANVLDTTTSISQSSTVDLLFRTSRWVEDLYLPVFLIGVGLMRLGLKIELHFARWRQ